MIEKVIRDGKVAVLVSPGFGAGWSTWADDAQTEWMVFAPEVVAWVEAGKPGGENGEELKAIVRARFGDNHPYLGGAVDLVIQWVTQGEAFQINEYDGSESLDLRGKIEWHIA